jgi:hypothetical protein
MWIVLVVAGVVRLGDAGQGLVLSRKLVDRSRYRELGGAGATGKGFRPVSARRGTSSHAPTDRSTAFER